MFVLNKIIYSTTNITVERHDERVGAIKRSLKASKKLSEKEMEKLKNEFISWVIENAN